ncbi:hypothetical protein FRB91_000985, partial [Serendipita sp. 411]
MPSYAQERRFQSAEQLSDSGGENLDDEIEGEPKGKKKGQGSQASRRDQNRIAQREFRLRKQQR